MSGPECPKCGSKPLRNYYERGREAPEFWWKGCPACGWSSRVNLPVWVEFGEAPPSPKDAQ